METQPCTSHFDPVCDFTATEHSTVSTHLDTSSEPVNIPPNYITICMLTFDIYIYCVCVCVCVCVCARVHACVRVYKNETCGLG